MLRAQDYYPFGMLQPDWSYALGSYRYGFNGQEKSDEIKGDGNSYTAMFWEYDPRIARRWNVDPRPIIGTSSYQTFSNNPTLFSDAKGDTVGVMYNNGFVPKGAYYKDGQLYDRNTHKSADLSKDYSNFAYQTLAYLNAFSQIRDPELHKKFETLINSKKNHVISNMTSEYGTVTTSQSLKDEMKNISTGTTISFDPFAWVKDGDIRHPAIALAHELFGHSYDADQGITLFGKSEYNIPLYEVKAVDAKNRLRREMGERPRLDYMNVPILESERESNYNL